MDEHTRQEFSQGTDGDAGEEPGGTSRRSFLRASGGYATGVAAIVGVPAAVLLEAETAGAAVEKPKVVPDPKTPVPDGPVMAYVHDAKKGTVVIMQGTTQRTVQDRALVEKLLHAPKKPKKKAKKKASQAKRRTTRKTTTKKGG